MKALTCTIKDARVSIPVNSIIYLEGDGNYTYIYVEKKKRIYLARTMKSVLAEIADDSFIRIHKSFAVNKAFIKSMDEFKVELQTGKSLPMSRRHATLLKGKSKAKEKSAAPVMQVQRPSPEPNHIPSQIRSLFHYFGYGPTTPEVGGYIGFEHKVFPGNLAIYAKHSGCVCKITFCAPNTGSFVMGSLSAMPKTWTGLFNALRNHTRRLIAMRDAQYKQKAA